MRPIAAVIAVLGIVGVVAPSTANAGQAGNGSLTQAELVTFTENVGSALRFRQLGDTRTLGKGRAEVGVLFATEANDGWSGPRIAGRFGLSDRVDLGGWGGMNRDGDSGLVGADLRIALVSEGPNRPVSVSVRPSISSFVGTSEIWAAHAGVDLTVSKTFGRLSPYAGIAATSSIGLERSKVVSLERATTNGSLSYAGVSYRWRTLDVAGEIQNAKNVTYAVRIGSRF